MKTKDRKAPAEFTEIFRTLVRAVQPRFVEPDAVEVYWAALRHFPIDVLRESADTLARSRFWPNTGDWFAAASTLAPPPIVIEGSRRLDELEDLARNDPERDEISKRLGLHDQRALMARHGLAWR